MKTQRWARRDQDWRHARLRSRFIVEREASNTYRLLDRATGRVDSTGLPKAVALWARHAANHCKQSS